MKTAILAATVLSISTAAAARPPEPDCHAITLAPVRDDMNNVWQKGRRLPVTIARDAPGGGQFCAHGGSCLPRRRGGREIVRLTDCAIGPSIGNGDYRLVQASRRR